VPEEKERFNNILGKNINSSKNLKPGSYFIKTKENCKIDKKF